MAFKGTCPGEKRREIGAVEENVFWFVDAEQSADCGQKIDGASWLILDTAATDFSFPVEDSRDAVAAFEVRSLFPSQFATPILAVTAVVGGVVDDGVVDRRFLPAFEGACASVPSMVPL